MKYILQISASLGIGGLEKVTRDIGVYANHNKYEVHYVVFGEHIGEYEKELLECGCKIFHLNEPSLEYRRFLSDLKDIIAQYHYDVIHAHTMFNIGLVMMAAKQMHVPIRVSHAHSALDNKGGMKKSIYEIIMRYLITHCSTDFIACGEKAGIRLFGKKIYTERATVILNGIDTTRFKYNNEIRERLRLQLGIEQRFVIGHVGHLASVKNQSFLIKLLPLILKDKPNAVLLLLGDGPDKNMLEELIYDQNLSNYVIMTGNVPNVNDYLNAMDVFAFPSIFEGMPLSIVEAQANGLPCVLSTGVPKDVYLTDLIHPLELTETYDWVNTICSLERCGSEKYAEELYSAGVDVKTAMKKIYDVYERAV